ncbi:MAG: acyl-CoA reductase, partial [Planctomycetaceae bacterium]
MSPGIEPGIDYGRSHHAPDMPLAGRLAWLRSQRSGGRSLPFPERLAALERLGQALVERRATLPPVLAGTGVAFLAAFLQRCSLEGYVQREIPRPESLERFVECGDRKSLRVLPRGLVCHWIAGNV